MAAGSVVTTSPCAAVRLVVLRACGVARVDAVTESVSGRPAPTSGLLRLAGKVIFDSPRNLLSRVQEANVATTDPLRPRPAHGTRRRRQQQARRLEPPAAHRSE